MMLSAVTKRIPVKSVINMLGRKNLAALCVAASCFACVGVPPASAGGIFVDDFSQGNKDAYWGNERGGWQAPKGTYGAKQTVGFFPSYSSVLSFKNVQDCTFTVKIDRLNTAGVWLHSFFADGLVDGVLLVAGGEGAEANTLHWNVFVAGVSNGSINAVKVPKLHNSNITLTVRVTGNTYAAYIGNSTTPVTTLTTSSWPAGNIALYDNAPHGAVALGQQFVFASLQLPN